MRSVMISGIVRLFPLTAVLIAVPLFKDHWRNTLTLHSEMLRGDRSALALAVFIGTFWSIRIAMDIFVYDHSDWPKGFQFVIGHILLNVLFCALIITYFSLAAWHGWIR